jgi:hypothetical protein
MRYGGVILRSLFSPAIASVTSVLSVLRFFFLPILGHPSRVARSNPA